ncbi:type ISP restriction/modification enzyme [Streptantibioticus cattleyicolor]|uniref:Type ISP restriction-modification enzyme LLaBIII C-terminal specificity domain-containing protein n=1 Tax=Streptantibioticus cattleyicolor (strain ATCC 35852 / DSM 46488 / JCM 4925 / NBRC 14057 / NRRL 8057) TaxID=1003195 RepID=F8JX21_STREN|nr:hypothetical protein SCATT_09190 [Streptantibioticus cattleyicolor NRRL 8057 = DSM 46488]MYS58010.1 DNA methyltransferase [Streptomyces sp. SID5468]CCB73651.1 conserved protein of unknown function [Streptantibioticus cattleyicolor NRRL 8057 = DSM 46488]
MSDDVLLLDDVLPWSVERLRLGREWVAGPCGTALKERWEALVRAGDEAERAALFVPTRARDPYRGVAQLPGHPVGTGPIAEERGRAPEPVRVVHAPFDHQWLIPDHRLIDVARPELWRVADDRQLFVVEPSYGPRAEPDPVPTVTALLPSGPWPPGRIRPLYRRPGGLDPNVTPGLADWLAGRWGRPVGAEDLLAWIAAAARPVAGGCAVPLPSSPALLDEGLALGRRTVWLLTRGAAGSGGPGAGRPRLPGGRRPYVRAALPARVPMPDYDPREEALLIGTGRIAPVPCGAWEFEMGGEPVIEAWFARRVERIPRTGWPQGWTSELLELITILALLDELLVERAGFTTRLAAEDHIGRAELRRAGILPVPASARRPASVLDHQEEGPGGQFALL